MRTRLSALAACTVIFLATVCGSAENVSSSQEGYVTTSDDARLFYQKIGSGRNTVIIPGGLFLARDFKALAKDRTVIFYDMRNRGRSDRIEDTSKITIEADVRDLEAIRKHFGVAKFSAVGYSYLGMMIVLYAMQHPERINRLVQIGAVPLKYDTEYPAHLVNRDQAQVVDQAEWNEIQEWRKQGLNKSKPKEFCEKQWRVWRRLMVGDASKAQKLDSPCDMPNEWPVNFDRHLEAHFVGSVQKMKVPKEQVAAKVKHPVLTIHGTKDRNAPYGAGREWALILPNARLISVAGAAHAVFVDEPAVLTYIDEFLRGRWPAKAERITKL
jgi:pimeloyl-ACP methyl ester carboxylesterase